MSVLRSVARRVAFGLFSAWAVMTTVFLSFTVTEDWVTNRIEGRIRFAAGGFGGPPLSEEELDSQLDTAISGYLNQRELNRPLSEQYVDWMGSMLTLDWGRSFERQVRGGGREEVFPLVTEAAVRSGTYIVPAILLAVALGMGIGLYVALNPESRLAGLGRVGAYVVFVLPSFWLGGMFVSAAGAGVIDRYGILYDHILPVGLVTMTLLGGYVSYSRAYAREQAAAEFVTLVRAKGAGSRRIARHVLRNAAIPIVSLLFTEAIGLLVLGIFVVEVLFGIEGLGFVLLNAVDARDLPVLLGSTLIIIFVTVVGNVVQDISYQYLDPRVGDD